MIATFLLLAAEAMTFTADRIAADGVTHALAATGHVVATSGPITLRGESLSRTADGTMTFSPFPEHDALPLNWFVGTYTGRASDHVVITGYFKGTMGATVSIAVKQSGDATATINWDDGSRDTYSLKCYEGSLTPDSCTLKASYADRLQGAKLYYDVSMTITRNRDSVPTATFLASSSGYLYVRTIYGYDTISYSDTLKNESELRKK